MKNIFNKFAFFIALSFVFISCGNLTTSENDDSIPQGKGKIAISTDLQNGRSVLPTAIEETTTGLKWELVGTKDGTKQIIKYWTDFTDEVETVTAYKSMTSDLEIFIDTGTWDFTLTASLTASQNNATEELNVLQAHCNSVQINAGNNALNFVMQEATEKAASGSIEFTLNFPKDVVGKVVATLYKYDNDNNVVDTNRQLAINNSSNDFDSVKYSYPDATGTTSTDLSAGYYILKIELQQKKGDATTPTVEPKTINTYSCLIRVAPGLSSIGKYTLPDLAQLYTIKYECGRGNIENQLITTSYNAYTSFELPEPTLGGHYFAGWYTQESNGDNTITEKFFGNAGETKTISEDITLYAKYVKAYEFNLYDPTGKPVSDGYKVEKGIGSVTLSNKGNSVWDYYLKSTDIEFTEKNNYKITVEMKAEADSVVAIQAANADMFFTVGTEWTPCTMETGFIEKELDESRNGISFGIGLSEKTSFRNLVIEPISSDDDGLPTLVFDITTEGINQYLKTTDKADKIIEVKKVVDASGMATGYAITINAPLTNNDSVQNVKLHLRDYAKSVGANNVSFEVKNTGEYPFATSFMADTASNNSMAWNNVRTPVDFNGFNTCNIDFPNYAVNDELTVDVITGSDNVYSNYPVEFTISNFKVEEPAATSTPFANKIFAIKTGNTWTQEKSVEVTIPVNDNKKFDVGMFNGWNGNMPSSFDDVTRFLYTGNIPEGLTYSTGTDDSGPTYTVTNNSNAAKIVKIALNDNYEVVIEDVSSIVTTWAELKYRIGNTSISEIVIKNDLTATERIYIGGRIVKIIADSNVIISRAAEGEFFIIYDDAGLELGCEEYSITLDGKNDTVENKGPFIWQYQQGLGVTLTNCILQNNTLSNADEQYERGAAIKTEQLFTMNNCSISNCHGSNGGAVYTVTNGSFTMNGGSISGCTAKENGNAVYIGSGNLTLSGDAEITSDNDVYIANGNPVIVAGELTKDKVATIKLPSYNVDSPVLTVADSSISLAEQVGKFTLKNENYKISDDGRVAQNSGGGNELLIENAYYVSANGDDSNNGLKYDTPFKTLNKAITSANNSDSKTVYVIGTLNATSESSSDSETVFFIAASVGTAASPINIIGYPDSDATLSALDDTGAANKRVFETDSESYIKMKDLILTGGNAGKSGAAIYYYNGELTLEDCKINGNKTTYSADFDSGIYYDGIYMYGSSNKLNMKNTECTDGIYLYNCTANFDDDCLLGYDDSTEIPIMHINNSSLNLGDVYFSNSIYSDAKSPICLTTSLTKHSNDEPIYIKLPNNVEGNQIISATSGVPLTGEVKKFTLSDTNYTISDDGKVVQNSGGV